MARKKGKTDFTVESQQNLMKVVEYLAADVFRPTGAQEISLALGITYNKVIWAMHNLVDRGWCDQVADGWRLSPRIVKISDQVRATFEENRKRYLG